MLKSKRHWLLVVAIILWMVAHLLLRSAFPAFLRSLLAAEVIAHIAVLGIAITAVRNRVGWWKKPTYGDDGLLSIENTAKLAGTSYEELPTRWNEIGYIVAELLT
jgi:hypothetical protein